MIPLKPLKEKRMAHCVSVAKLCYDLALAYDVEPMRAYLCGVFHDIAREIPEDEMIPLAKARDIPVGEAERRSPLLLHGALAAAAMAENYGIGDEEMLNAVRRHTVGAPAMTLLDKILFIADKTEPLRVYDGAASLRELAFTDLNRALALAVENEIRYCGEHGYSVHPDTLAMKQRRAEPTEIL